MKDERGGGGIALFSYFFITTGSRNSPIPRLRELPPRPVAGSRNLGLAIVRYTAIAVRPQNEMRVEKKEGGDFWGHSVLSGCLVLCARA